jgi:uncharacterized protein (TIGR02270 family)
MTDAEHNTNADWILWDVVEEHLAEGAFAYLTWRRRLESPADTLTSLESRFEARLKAHVDGLLVGGAAVAERVLVPELSVPKEPDVDRSSVAALALIQQGKAGLVQDALGSEIPEVQTGAERALSLLGPPSVDRWLMTAVASARSPAAMAVLLRVAAARRAPLDDIATWLKSTDAAEAEAAAMAARRAPMAPHGRALHEALASSHEQVRDAALQTTLAADSAYAFQKCLELASDRAEPHPTAMLLVALLGNARHQDVVVAQLASPTHRAAALRALGFSGNPQHVDQLLALAADKDELVAKLAGEALFNIAGLQAHAAVPEQDDVESLPPPEVDVPAAELVPGPEAELVLPDAAACRELWSRMAPGVDSRRRLLQGRAWTMPWLREVLTTGRLRQRHPLALWLRIRTGGRLDLETRAMTTQQRAWLRENASAFDDASLVLNYEAH